MKFKVSFRPYPSGAGSRVHDELWTIEGQSLRDALDKFYCRPDFNPEWRVIDVREPLPTSEDLDAVAEEERIKWLTAKK